MSDAEDATDELEAIRQRKRERLEELLEEGQSLEDALGDAEDDAEASAPGEPIHVEGQGHFEELLSSHELVFVDFYADWCGPCQMLEPVVEEVAAETPAAVAKVDSDVHQGLAQQYGVQGLPTMLLFRDGEPVERLMGYKEKGELTSLIQRHAPGE
ncbi:MAG: thioredoxin [Haloferacaceae archaeon]